MSSPKRLNKYRLHCEQNKIGANIRYRFLVQSQQEIKIALASTPSLHIFLGRIRLREMELSEK